MSGQADPIGHIPDGWARSQLYAICDVFGGGKMGLTKEKHYQTSGVVAYSAAGPDGFVEQSEISGADGVVLSAIGARCGRCFFASGSWTTLANVQAIIPRGELDAKFLFYYVNRDGYWERSGSAQPFIKPSSIKSSWIVYPPVKSEQAKIAEILTAVDRAIEQTEALVAKQQRIKTGLMQDLLTRGIDAHGHLRTEQTHAFKDSPLGRIPVEWEVVPLSQVVDELITYGIVQAGPNIEDGVPYIRTGDMSGDSINRESLFRTSQKLAKAYKRSEVHEGDIVFALRATVGKVLPVDSILDGANLTQGTAKISPMNGIVSEYLIQALRAKKVQDQIRLCEKGTTFMEITLTDLRQILVGVPKAKPEQNAIADVLNSNDKTTARFADSLAKLRALKTALMQDLLTGRKRVTGLLAGTEGRA